MFFYTFFHTFPNKLIEKNCKNIVFTLFLHGHFGPKTLETHRKNIEITSKIPFITRIAMFFQCFFDKFIWKSMKKNVEKHRKNIGKTLIKTRPM